MKEALKSSSNSNYIMWKKTELFSYLPECQWHPMSPSELFFARNSLRNSFSRTLCLWNVQNDVLQLWNFPFYLAFIKSVHWTDGRGIGVVGWLAIIIALNGGLTIKWLCETDKSTAIPGTTAVESNKTKKWKYFLIKIWNPMFHHHHRRSSIRWFVWAPCVNGDHRPDHLDMAQPGKWM